MQAEQKLKKYQMSSPLQEILAVANNDTQSHEYYVLAPQELEGGAEADGRSKEVKEFVTGVRRRASRPWASNLSSAFLK